MKLSRFWPVLKVLLTISILIIIALFIITELQRSNLQIADIAYRIHWPLIPLAVIVFCIYFFVISMGLWYLLNNGSMVKISTIKNFGIFNISGLTKYLPGKVWSYAILFYALKEHGISVSKAVFDSLTHLILTITTPFLLMMPVAVFLFLPQLSLTAQLAFLFFGVVFYILCLFASPYLLKMLVACINYFKKKEPIVYIALSRKNILITQVFILAGYLLYILSISIIVYSIEQSFYWITIVQIAVICVFSAIIGFLVLIVPGGIGIQESLIFLLTNIHQADPGFSLVLPIIVRLVGVITDLIVGLASLWLIREVIVKVVFKKAGDRPLNVNM